MPPSKEDDPRRRQDEESSSSSWFSSWFERDMRDEIHEQLNAFDERKKQYEQAQEERRKFLQQHAASSSAAFPFPFFFPPEHDNSGGGRSNNSNSNSVPRGQWDDFEEFLGGRIPRPRWQDHGTFDGDGGDKRRGRSQSPWDSDARENRQRDQESIEDLHREMQQMFEAAFGGGMMPPQGGTRSSGSWTSSSTVVSSSNGTSYTMKQDSQNGARVDLQLPKNCQSENLSLEVLRDSPCLIRWKNQSNDENDEPHPRHGRSPNEQVLELGNSVDCSRLSASISEAQRTLTVQAPPRGTGGGGDDEGPLSLKPNSYPRPVRVTKKQ